MATNTKKVRYGINPTKNSLYLKTIADAYRSMVCNDEYDIEAQLKNGLRIDVGYLKRGTEE